MRVEHLGDLRTYNTIIMAKKRINNLVGLYLRTNTIAQAGDLEALEQRLCSTLFDSSTPLGRCIQAEIDFNLIPFPHLEGTHIAIRGECGSDTLLTMIACHPSARIKDHGIVHAIIEVNTFDRFLEEAFIAYLSYFLGKRHIRRRISNDRRFSRVVDPNTGELTMIPNTIPGVPVLTFAPPELRVYNNLVGCDE